MAKIIVDFLKLFSLGRALRKLPELKADGFVAQVEIEGSTDIGWELLPGSCTWSAKSGQLSACRIIFLSCFNVEQYSHCQWP
jgi:hypothetical protein